MHRLLNVDVEWRRIAAGEVFEPIARVLYEVDRARTLEVVGELRGQHKGPRFHRQWELSVVARHQTFGRQKYVKRLVWRMLGESRPKSPQWVVVFDEHELPFALAAQSIGWLSGSAAEHIGLGVFAGLESTSQHSIEKRTVVIDDVDVDGSPLAVLKAPAGEPYARIRLIRAQERALVDPTPELHEAVSGPEVIEDDSSGEMPFGSRTGSDEVQIAQPGPSVVAIALELPGRFTEPLRSAKASPSPQAAFWFCRDATRPTQSVVDRSHQLHLRLAVVESSPLPSLEERTMMVAETRREVLEAFAELLDGAPKLSRLKRRSRYDVVLQRPADGSDVFVEPLWVREPRAHLRG